MTNNNRTADDIERDIEDERAQMSGTINELQKKFSVEGIVSDIGAMFRDQGGDAGRYITETVGRNPAAMALIGVGLAWLILGKSRAKPAPRKDRDTSYGGNWGRSFPAGRRPNDATEDGDRSWFDDHGMAENQKPRSHGVGAAMNAATGAASGVVGSMRSGAGAVVDAVSSAAGSVRDKAAELTDRLASGTEGLSEEAKARVMAARRLAHDARVASQQALKEGGRMAANLFTEQPLVVGALAVAVGAGLGSLLPHSQLEDDTLGAHSDRLFDEAQRVFREERDKAMAVVKAAANEATGALKDTRSELADLLPEGKTAGNVIVDHISDAAARVSNTAKEEATRQGLMADRDA
jgi:hypothetical protein